MIKPHLPVFFLSFFRVKVLKKQKAEKTEKKKNTEKKKEKHRKEEKEEKKKNRKTGLKGLIDLKDPGDLNACKLILKELKKFWTDSYILFIYFQIQVRCPAGEAGSEGKH